ncbi:succinylglutamate desuccinylase/aspartoacylase family protein [Aestuariirhabdus sp. Z084]|uniref:succinylglutamate desuccinylase/aspartoacylase domain-containing protein n=1 Tax=Aestuariirhabdus haliotis TaxID=2918751 RepID=UPI00201B3C5D|nr:succinylglutamate desuccinylase/aspartoacylase family protein [Aestuariirhabdus haliotis]MCL6415344.1 succinylglutamate desuccinylase/aspartoacylase family protein [Aestuariirhabdus haliotis]MCL6419100.1 succinylglutamate desuccinylase/aspartoacylase family protein [Aestuariirhabdus haliotis]
MDDYETLHRIEGLSSLTLEENPLGFLRQLPGPCAIWLEGEDPSRTRAVCTLLHGNEPSGCDAIWHFIKRGQQPKTNCLLVIASVQAALTPPLYSHRMLPQHRDLNRCFRPPFDDSRGNLAQQILAVIEDYQPEALLDIHNTSGSGPAFGVCVNGDMRHRALASLFTHDLIVTDLRLGALMELGEDRQPTVTIECGGSGDPAANLVAREGIFRFLCSDQVLSSTAASSVTTYPNPLRLELAEDTCLRYSDDPKTTGDLILATDAEALNYGTASAQEPIARLGPKGFDKLRINGPEGEMPVSRYFEARNGKLYTRGPTRLFMVTTREEIALSDCLFYFMS